MKPPNPRYEGSLKFPGHIYLLLIIGSLSLVREILAFRGVHVGANYFGNVKAVIATKPTTNQNGQLAQNVRTSWWS
jgi:hypothetical protein